MPCSSILPDYSRQARTYDETRAASPSILGPLRAALAGAPGRRLADIGGGTGNYALALRERGWDPVVIDRSAEMLARARRKGLATITGDAQRLPVADARFDAAMLVSMLHHVEDQGAAIAEAQRVLRPRGRLALMVFTREDIEEVWFMRLFPSTREWMRATHARLAELLALLPGARRLPILFRDMSDGSLVALSAHPEKLLDERWRRQMSYFERLEREHPQELRDGLERLAAELAAGTVPRRPGRASVIAWRKA